MKRLGLGIEVSGRFTSVLVGPRLCVVFFPMMMETPVMTSGKSGK